jgi:hypothetical protein
MDHHQKLEELFSGFSFTLFSQKHKLLKNFGRVAHFCFLTGMDKKSGFSVFGPPYEIEETQIYTR